MRIALIQTQIVWNDPKKNVEQFGKLVIQAKNGGALLILLPEMFTTGFSLPLGKEAEAAYQIGTTFLKECSESHNIYIAGSIPSGDFSKPCNTLFLYGPNGKLGSYSKLHLFSFAEEHLRYSAGNKLLNLTINDLRVSFFICYDLRFGIPFATLAKKTDLFVVVANWPAKRRVPWKTLITTRAVENQCYCAGVNCVGEIGGLTYSGDSLVVAPNGDVALDCASGDGVFVVDISKELVTNERGNFSALKDRRWDLYSNWASGCIDE